MDSRILRGIGVACLWIFVGSVLTLEIYFNYRAAGEPHEHADVIDVAIPQFGRAIMWAAMVPFILALRRRVPLTMGNWAGGLAFHFMMSFVVMAVYYLGRVFFYMRWDDVPLDQYWWKALNGFYGRNIVDMAYYWAVLAFGYSLEIYQKFKSEELKAAQLEARLVETELRALRQQMHPHFLFNTLNTVAVLVREGKNDAAVGLLSRLGALLRLTLQQHGVPEVTLREELDFLDRYIEIQRARFPDRLSVDIDMTPEVLDARIPNLLLQPLVENAILHGIAPKPGPGRVEIRGRVLDRQLELEVRDDGPGFDPAAPGRREGIGTANTRERLSKLYGANQKLVIESGPGRGVTVLISIPFRT